MATPATEARPPATPVSEPLIELRAVTRTYRMGRAPRVVTIRGDRVVDG